MCMVIALKNKPVIIQSSAVGIGEHILGVWAPANLQEKYYHNSIVRNIVKGDLALKNFPLAGSPDLWGHTPEPRPPSSSMRAVFAHKTAPHKASEGLQHFQKSNEAVLRAIQTLSRGSNWVHLRNFRQRGLVQTPQPPCKPCQALRRMWGEFNLWLIYCWNAVQELWMDLVAKLNVLFIKCDSDDHVCLNCKVGKY